jgi:hypothetical protein
MKQLLYHLNDIACWPKKSKDMAIEIAEVRDILGCWQPALAAGAGKFTPTERPRWVWRLDLEGRSYAVKAPRPPDTNESVTDPIQRRLREARLQQALYAAGFPVPEVLWEDSESGLFVMEWIEGESLYTILQQPHSYARNHALERSIVGLAHIETIGDIVQSIMPTPTPPPPDPDQTTRDVLHVIHALAPRLDTVDVQPLCNDLAQLICTIPAVLGVTDLIPHDIIWLPNQERAIFIDFEHCLWRSSAWRFYQFFARYQRDVEDRAFQTGCFLREFFLTARSEPLDAFYLFTDIDYYLGMQEYCNDETVKLKRRTQEALHLPLDRARITWPGACATANNLRKMLYPYLQ